jgi:hypothetical protein
MAKLDPPHEMRVARAYAQAAWIIVAERDCTFVQALDQLMCMAEARGLTVYEVARSVLDGMIRFDG